MKHILPLLLLCGCATTEQPKARLWQVSCDPQGDARFIWSANGKTMTNGNSIVITAPVGSVVRCRATDGTNTSAASLLILTR